MTEQNTTDAYREFQALPAAKNSERFSAVGDKCLVESSSFPFFIEFSGGNKNRAKAGTKFDFNGHLFDTIRIEKPTEFAGLAFVCVLWIGTAHVEFNFPIDPPTSPCCRDITTLPTTLLTALTFYGTAQNGGLFSDASYYSRYGVTVGALRRQYTVSVPSTGNGGGTTYVTDLNGTIFDAVDPAATTGDRITYFSTMDFKVYGAAATKCRVIELFNL